MHRAGDRFGPYVLETLLGQGVSGQVWKARDLNLSRTVALKILSLDDPDDVHLFLREARTAAALDHPNIAAVYDIGAAAGFHYIAMQFIDGAPPRGPMRPRDAARIVRDAARAVQFAHERQIIHRDLKPSNLLVSGGRVYVMDFGLARSTRHAASLTASGVLVGSPAFMSPEQARGDRATPASDVWCLGTTLHNLLSGSHPFEGDALVVLLKHITESDPRPLPPAVPRDLAAVVATCLEKDPARRYGSAGELADNLDRFLAGRPVTTRGSGTLARIAAPISRHRVAAAVGTAALAAVLVLVAVLVPKIRRTESRTAHRDAMQRLENAIVEARPFFYIRDADMRAKLASVEAALAHLERVEPKDAEVWTTIGEGRYVTGDPTALEALRRAIELRADHPRAHLLMARVCLERALAAQLAARERRDEVTPWVIRASEHLDRVPEDAAADPVTAHVVRAWRAFLSRRDYATTCDEGLARFASAPGTEDFHLLLCFLHLEAAPIERTLARAMEVRPHFPLGRVALAVVRLNSGRPREALDDADEAIRIHPRLAAAHAVRGSALSRLGDRAAAVAAFREAVRLDPGDAESWMDLAALLGASDPAAARAAVDEAIRLRPDSAYARIARASVRLDGGDLDAARADFEEATRLDDRLAGPHAGLARIHAQRGDRAAAERCYAEAMKRDPRDPVLRVNAGVLLFGAGRYAEALPLFDEALRLRPGLATAHLNRGLTHQKLGDASRAGADYDAALDADPDLYDARLHRAQLRRARDDVEGALADLDRAVAADPRRPDAYALRTAIRLKNGDRDGAIADLRRALEVAPRDWPKRASFEQMLRELQR